MKRNLRFYWIIIFLLLSPVALAQPSWQDKQVLSSIKSRLVFLEQTNPLDASHYTVFANLDPTEIGQSLEGLLVKIPDNPQFLGLMALYQWKVVNTSESRQLAKRYFERLLASFKHYDALYKEQKQQEDQAVKQKDKKSIEELMATARQQMQDMANGKVDDNKNNLLDTMIIRDQLAGFLGHYAHYLAVVEQEEQAALELYKKSNLSSVLAWHYAELLKKSGADQHEIIDVYKRSWRRGRFHADVIVKTQEYLDSINQPGEADYMLVAWLSESPDDPQRLDILANRMVNQGKFNRAESFFRRQQDLKQTDYPMSWGYALFLESKRQDLEGAQQVFETVMQTVLDSQSTLAMQFQWFAIANYAGFLQRTGYESTPLYTKAWQQVQQRVEQSSEYSAEEKQFFASLQFPNELADVPKNQSLPVKDAMTLSEPFWIERTNLNQQTQSLILYASREGNIPADRGTPALVFFCNASGVIETRLSFHWAHYRLNSTTSLQWDNESWLLLGVLPFETRRPVPLSNLEALKTQSIFELITQHKRLRIKRDFVIMDFNLVGADQYLNKLKAGCKV